MIKVLLVSSDEELYSFCQRLQENHISVIRVSPFADNIGDFFCQASLVLFDFEILKNGYNTLTEQIYSSCAHSPLIPLVKEDNLSTALRIMRYKYEDIVQLPCCIEYLYMYVKRRIDQLETSLLSPTENKIMSLCIGISDEMLLFKKKLTMAAQNDLSVLLLGETGTGKSYIARLIHKLSARREKKFVEENIAAIQETLIEGELFGTKTGAYTGAVSRIGLFEHAHNGTLFLDEIGCIKNSMQAKLLQFLETGMYRPVGAVELKKSDVRLITATNLSLKRLKNSKHFRNDLYYRINGVQLHIPPLRKRKEDIFPLAEHFLENLNSKNNVKKELCDDSIAKLESHSWPGNIRELERCIECAFYMSSHSLISGRDINFVF